VSRVSLIGCVATGNRKSNATRRKHCEINRISTFCTQNYKKRSRETPPDTLRRPDHFSPGLTIHSVHRVCARLYIITFRVSRRPREMYCAWSRASVCLSVCLSAAACPHYCTDPDVTWGSGRGYPLVVHYWADLQSATLWKCVAEPSGNPPGPAHAARTTHARTHARTSDKIDVKIGRVRRYLQRGRSISSILRGCCNANAKC